MVSTRIIWPIFLFTFPALFQPNHGLLGEEEKRNWARKFVEEVNQRNGGKWRAAYNERFAMMEEEEKRRLAGAIIDASVPRQQVVNSSRPLENAGRPPSNWEQRQCRTQVDFDAREKWPQCAEIINTIQDQSDCASCYAVATASVYTDRHCIERAKAGLAIAANSPSAHFSALDVLACAPNSNGCNGGYPDDAWAWIRRNGICTGTGYKWGEGCKPYPFRPTHREQYSSPTCMPRCTNDNWERSYYADKNYPTWIGSLEGNSLTIRNIKEEIRVNGSVAAIMDLYSDIYFYNSGVYAHSNNARYEMGHVVRLIGWGTQHCSDGYSTDFWLAMNSWNRDWGEDGVFKIERGTNECGIEQYGMYFGTPRIREEDEEENAAKLELTN